MLQVNPVSNNQKYYSSTTPAEKVGFQAAIEMKSRNILRYAKQNKSIPPAVREFVDFVKGIGIKTLYKRMRENDLLGLRFYRTTGSTSVRYEGRTVSRYAVKEEKRIISEFMNEDVARALLPEKPNSKARKKLTFKEWVNYIKFKKEFNKVSAVIEKIDATSKKP